MKKKHFICLILAMVMTLVSSIPVLALDKNFVLAEDTCCNTDHVEDTDNNNKVIGISPMSIDPRCWVGNHDWSGPINFSDYHFIHRWNDTSVCKIFYFNNVSCSRFLCISTKDVFTGEAIATCNIH